MNPKLSFERLELSQGDHGLRAAVFAIFSGSNGTRSPVDLVMVMG